MGVTRIWQITLLLLAPLFIFEGETIALGIMKLFRACSKRFVSLNGKLNYRTLVWFPVVVILIPYFIFNTGIIFELSRSQTIYFINMPYSIALSSYRLDLNTVFTRQDLTAACFVCKEAGGDEPVYADHHSSKLSLNPIDFPCNITEVPYNTKEIGIPGYFFLRAWNIESEALQF